jgi:hypothetical protein
MVEFVGHLLVLEAKVQKELLRLVKKMGHLFLFPLDGSLGS